MLSGRPVFPGEDVSEILAGVIKSEPPWDELPPQLAAPARTLLRRCLASPESERLHSAADVRILLQEALEEQRRPRPETPAGMDSAPPSILGRLLPWALAAAALVVAGVALFWGGGGTQPAQPVTRFHVTPEAGSRYYLAHPPFFDLMPDGRTLIYAAVDAEGTQRLYSRPLNSFLVTPLTGTEGAESPFVSPSGWIGFVADSKLKRTMLNALAPPVITNVADAFQGGTWSADGAIIYSDDFDSGLLRVPSNGGTPEVLTRPDRERGETLHCLPMALPGGKGVVFTVEYAPTLENPERTRDTMVLDLESGETRLLWESTEGPYEYLPSGQLILRRANQLVAIGFDTATLQRAGGISRLLDTENDGMGDTPVFSYAAAEDGTLVYSSAGPLVTAGLHWVDRDGNAIVISDNPVGHLYPDLSTDGRRLSVTRENQIWIYELDGGQTLRLTHEGRSVISSWSPDDQTIVFGSYQPDEDLYRIATDGSGSMELLLGESNRQYPLDWNTETNTLLIQWTHPESGYDLWMLPMDGEGEAKPFLDSRHNERWGAFSPDGRWVVYASDESGRYEIYVRAFPDGGRKRVVSTQGGIEPRWSADGSEIFFSSGGAADLLRPQTTMMTVPVTMEGGPRFGPATVLFSGDYLSAACCAHTYDVAADGRRFVMTGMQPESHRRLNVVLHALASFDPGEE